MDSRRVTYDRLSAPAVSHAVCGVVHRPGVAAGTEGQPGMVGDGHLTAMGAVYAAWTPPSVRRVWVPGAGVWIEKATARL